MKALLAGLAGNRPKVIAVFGTTRGEVECGVRHARTSGTGLPIRAWCAEKCEPISGCERFVGGARSRSIARELREVWPALSVVAWTGHSAPLGLKLLPLLTPPFRVVLFNEAEGFFPARPAPVASHVARRVRDALAAKFQHAAELCSGAARWAGYRLWDAAQWIFWKIVTVAILLAQLLSREAQRAAGYARPVLRWMHEVGLAGMARIAPPLAPLSRAAVRQARGRKRKPAPPAFLMEPATKESFVEVEILNRVWSCGAMLRAAANCDAEFIVFRMRGETADAAPLMAVARLTNAFAVARQCAHAAWRKQVVHKHPFRRLQEGEVSEVFAPFSTLIVFRRSMLLRVGIPKALTYGGGLLLLFWKSSAAGLRSLVAGHSGPIGDEPAMALEDAELALRLMLSPRLAALAPARPFRSRGNVVWSARHCRPNYEAGSRPRVLVVSPYLPFPLSHGGAVRIYNLCRALSRDVDFVLACFREAAETVCYHELHEVFREVYAIDADQKFAAGSVPKQVAEYRNPAMSDLIRDLCLSRQVDIVQLEYTQLAEYRDDTGAIPVILVEHDITFSLYKQLADFEKTPRATAEYRRWLDFERMALQCSTMVWTMSPDECEAALGHGAPRSRTLVIPNGVDLHRFQITPPPAVPREVLFVGSFRHLPNLLAFEALRLSIMPAVWKAFPGAILHVIAGPNHEGAAELAGKSILLAPDPRIIIDGFVADVRPAYQSAAVVAVPLPLSAGTNIKLLEAMACGRAIVSTQSGCRGLGLASGDELIIAELENFAAALVKVLRDECLRMELARKARAAAERRFGWDAIADEALKCYGDLGGTQTSPQPIETIRASTQHA